MLQAGGCGLTWNNASMSKLHPRRVDLAKRDICVYPRRGRLFM